jgi:antitoxin component of RelBE/YafQ-DinJ toxin-antitoxin module
MISLRIDVDLLNDIKTYAKRHGMTVSGVLKFGASKLIER